MKAAPMAALVPNNATAATARTMEDFEGVLKIVRCMQSWREHEEVQEKGCMEISNLCANQYYGELLRETGGIEAVVEAILRFPNSLRVQFAAVQAIANLSQGSNQARLRLCAAGAGRVLVQCLVRSSQDQAMLIATWGASILQRCEELRCLCVMAMAQLLQLEENTVPLLEAGSWEIVVRSMAKFPAEDELQLWGCRILSTLAEGLHSSGAVNVGAIKLLMKRTPACQVVVAASGRVLQKLIAVSGGAQPLQLAPAGVSSTLLKGGWLTCCALAALASISQENAAQLVALGACRQVERIMNFCQDEMVQEWGARSLAEIALSIRGGASSSPASILPATAAQGQQQQQQQQGRMIRAEGTSGGCAAVMGALSRFPHNARVQFAGCYAVANLAAESRSNQLIFYELGAAPVIARALELFPQDPNIQEWGARAFAELAMENSHNQLAVLEAGGCSALVAALAAFPTVPRVLFGACYAVVQLAAGSAHCRKRLGEAGACRHIERGLAGPCAADLNVVEWACRALGDLAQESEENTAKVRATGGCRHIVAALARFPDSAGVQFAGCYALTHLASGDRAVQVHLGELGACERVVQAVVDFPRQSNVRAWAFRALIALAAKSDISVRLMKDGGNLYDMVKILKVSNLAAEEKQQLQQRQLQLQQQQQRQQQQLLGKNGGR